MNPEEYENIKANKDNDKKWKTKTSENPEKEFTESTEDETIEYFTE